MRGIFMKYIKHFNKYEFQIDFSVTMILLNGSCNQYGFHKFRASKKKDKYSDYTKMRSNSLSFSFFFSATLSTLT